MTSTIEALSPKAPAPVPECPFQDGSEVELHDNTFAVSNNGECIRLTRQPGGYAEEWQGMQRQMQKNTYYPLLRPLFSTSKNRRGMEVITISTIDSLNGLVEERFSGLERAPIKLVQAPLGNGKYKDQSPDEYDEYLDNNELPVGATPGLFFHDVVDHGLGAATTPDRTFKPFKSLIKDAQAVSQYNEPAGNLYIVDLARAFDSSSGIAMERSPGGERMLGAYLLTESLMNLKKYPNLYYRADRIIEDAGLSLRWPDRPNIDWELDDLPNYYKQVEVVLMREPPRSFAVRLHSLFGR